MKVALAGLGGAATHGHLPALRQLEAQGRLRLVAVADRAVEPRCRLEAELEGVPTFAGAEEMLAMAEPDLLVVATEPAAHAGLVELGLSAGVSVVCEKPLTHTAGDRVAVEAAVEEFAGPAVVTVLQYRYARTWWYLRLAARRFGALRLPFSMLAEVARNGIEDPYAASSWRADLEGSGGMLADHGTHYVALARTIDSEVSLLSAERFWDGPGRERSRAEFEIGSGRLELRLSTLARSRRTRVAMRVPGMAVEWELGRASFRVAGREAISGAAGDLSDRAYLDSLYVPFYEDLVRNLGDPSWRARRTAESLAVGRIVVEMLEGVARLDSISA